MLLTFWQPGLPKDYGCICLGHNEASDGVHACLLISARWGLKLLALPPASTFITTKAAALCPSTFCLLTQPLGL